MELELLPDHVLIEIFRSLSTHDLVNYRRVSKRWFRLISCPKYFQRAHRLKFFNCTLSATCPPLSVFKNSSQPFFRFLRIEKYEYNPDEEQEDWKNVWSELGNRITHLKLLVFFPAMSRILGDGSNWSQMIELETDCETNFPQKLKIPSLKTLKLLSFDKSEDLENNFPNLQKLHFHYHSNLYATLYSEKNERHFTDWELKRLREVKCNLLKLREIKTNTIQTLLLDNHDEINLNDKQLIESFIIEQENLLELKVDISGIPALGYWCQWTQLTELYISNPPLSGCLLGNYFTQLKNLKSIDIRLWDCNSLCFFGHEVVALPRLDKYYVEVYLQCEECWKSCLESFANAKDGCVYAFEKIKNYLYLLQNLESFSSHGVECFFDVENEEDRNLDVKPLPNVLKLYSSVVDVLTCSDSTHPGGYCHLEKDYQAFSYCFPNLSFLKIFNFNPIILQRLTRLQELSITDKNDCSQDRIDGIVQHGKNLRIIKFEDGCCSKEQAKYLFDNLELLVQVSDSYHDAVYTRSLLN